MNCELAIKIYIRTHTVEKPFGCNVYDCGKRFKRRYI